MSDWLSEDLEMGGMLRREESESTSIFWMNGTVRS